MQVKRLAPGSQEDRGRGVAQVSVPAVEAGQIGAGKCRSSTRIGALEVGNAAGKAKKSRIEGETFEGCVYGAAKLLVGAVSGVRARVVRSQPAMSEIKSRIS